VTLWPRRPNAVAAAIPPIPAPTIMTFNFNLEGAVVGFACSAIRMMKRQEEEKSEDEENVIKRFR
jgi:hypothetical protein